MIELLVIVGIIAVMVTMGILNVRSGQGASRLRSATRDVYASIRRARSQALVTGQSTVLTYSTEAGEDTSAVKIEIHGAKLISEGNPSAPVESLSGMPVETGAGDPLPPAPAGGEDSATGGGESLEEILFSPLSEEVVTGLRLKVELEDRVSEDDYSARQRKSKVSVFSNVDYILGMFKTARGENGGKEDAAAAGTEKKDVSAADETFDEPVSVLWSTNGRVDPHRVWIYLDGTRPESGLMIKVDRFGAAQVLSGDGRETEL